MEDEIQDHLSKPASISEQQAQDDPQPIETQTVASPVAPSGAQTPSVDDNPELVVAEPVPTDKEQVTEEPKESHTEPQFVDTDKKDEPEKEKIEAGEDVAPVETPVKEDHPPVHDPELSSTPPEVKACPPMEGTVTSPEVPATETQVVPEPAPVEPQPEQKPEPTRGSSGRTEAKPVKSGSEKTKGTTPVAHLVLIFSVSRVDSQPKTGITKLPVIRFGSIVKILLGHSRSRGSSPFLIVCTHHAQMNFQPQLPSSGCMNLL